MADGSTKLIRDIRIGDEVVATDPETGRTAARMVTATIVGTGVKHLVRIGVDADGDGDATGETIIATTAHPFWNARTESWVDARDLQPGDELRTSVGALVKVHRSSVYATSITVYNLTVADIHTYYVLAGRTPVLVHNQGGGESYVPSLKKLSGTQAEKYVGDVHEFKREILGRKAPISRYDMYVDTNNGNLYLNTKKGSAANAIETGFNRDGTWVRATPKTGGTPEGCSR